MLGTLVLELAPVGHVELRPLSYASSIGLITEFLIYRVCWGFGVLASQFSYASSDISHEGLLGEQGGCLVAASFLSFVDEKAFKICKDVVKGAIAVIAMFHGQHRN